MVDHAIPAVQSKDYLIFFYGRNDLSQGGYQMKDCDIEILIERLKYFIILNLIENI